MKPLALLPGLLLVASGAAAEVVVLRGGDQITGQIVGRGTRRIRLQTPYGLLVIPVDKIERIRKDDGTEESLNPRPSPSPTAAPAPVQLMLDLGGNTFWQAWDPKTPPADPSLQFVISLDNKFVAAYMDSVLDPGDLPKAVVNSFAFNPETLKLVPAPGVLLVPPEVKDGRVHLNLELPAGWVGPRRLRLAYQGNEGTALEPRWRDLAGGEGVVEVRLRRSNEVTVDQARGFMEFTRKQMRNVESFQVTLRSE